MPSGFHYTGEELILIDRKPRHSLSVQPLNESTGYRKNRPKQRIPNGCDLVVRLRELIYGSILMRFRSVNREYWRSAILAEQLLASLAHTGVAAHAAEAGHFGI